MAVSMRFAGTVTNAGVPVEGTVTVTSTTSPVGASGVLSPLAGRFSVNVNVNAGDTVTLTVDAGQKFTGTVVLASVAANRLVDLSCDIGSGALSLLQDPSTFPAAPTLTAGVKTAAITSGALPTVVPVSGTAFQTSTARDTFLTVPCTMNASGTVTATVAIAVSPDNVTFSTLGTLTNPTSATAVAGTVEMAQLAVPAGWWVKLTATNATLGTGTYY